MRGNTDATGPMFYVCDIESKIPLDHPLRGIRRRCGKIFAAMQRDFDRAYSTTGRPGIPIEQLLLALLLRALYSIRSEAQLMQAIDYNLLYRWFLGLPLDAPVWTPETFSMNRERFEKFALVRKFFDLVVAAGFEGELMSSDHFSVDGTLIRSLASDKSLVPREGEPKPPEDDDPGNPTVNFRGEKRTNQTHVSSTDAEARLMRKGKGKEAHLYHSGHALMENRKGLLVDVEVDEADGHAERRSALAMVDRARKRHKLYFGTLGADTGYDDGNFLRSLERRKITPHVPTKKGAIKASDANGRARRRARKRQQNKGYAISQRIRKRVEEIFGWVKVIGEEARTRFVKRWKITQSFLITGAVYNLLRLDKLERIAAVA